MSVNRDGGISVPAKLANGPLATIGRTILPNRGDAVTGWLSRLSLYQFRGRSLYQVACAAELVGDFGCGMMRGIDYFGLCVRVAFVRAV